MTNWPLIGPAPLTSFFDEQADSGNSIGYLSLNKSSDGGVWVEYSASWPETTNRLRIAIDDNTSNRDGGFEIGIGGSGSEISILNFPQTDYQFRGVNGLELPITIRAGERVSIRLETEVSATVLISLMGYNDPLFRTDFRRVDVMGKVSQGLLTAPDPGDTLHTKGAWLEIVASTSNDYKGILLVLGNSDNSETTTVNHLFDIAMGASGSEIIVIPDIWVQRFGRNVLPETRHFFISAHIPAGVRFAARCQADNNVSGVRDLTGVAILGFY